MRYHIVIDIDPPLTDPERAHFVEALRGFADSFERGDDETLGRQWALANPDIPELFLDRESFRGQIALEASRCP